MIQTSRPSLVDRFRSLLSEREDELGISDNYGASSLSTDEIVQIYEIVLSDLTVNSKPVIGELTQIAEEHQEHAYGIADAICSRIFEVPAEQKLFSLYLLDSIVKNIGCYVRCFASRLPEMFSETYRQVHPKFRPSMRHLFSTWSTIFPPSVLQKIETGLRFSAPISEQFSDVNAFRSSGSPRPAHGIHANPKYLAAGRQFKHSEVENIRETDTSAINAHKRVDGRKRKERDTSASPKRWSGASLTLHKVQNEREFSSNSQQYGLKPIVAYDYYDVDNSELITSRGGLGSSRVSSIGGAEKLPSSVAKHMRLPTSPSRFESRSLSPSGNEFSTENSPARVSPLHSKFAYIPSNFNGNDRKKENFFTEYHPDGSHEPLESSRPYKVSNGYNHDGPRALIDAYGNDRGNKSLNEKPLKVDINVNGLSNDTVTKRWQNSEEDEYMWEDMSPTLANQRSNDFIPSNHHLDILNTRTSLEMESALLLKPDVRRGSWDPHAPLSVLDDPVTTAEERNLILGPGVGSTSARGSQYATTQNLGSHYSEQPWNTQQTFSWPSHHLNVKTSGHMSFSMPRMAPSSGQNMSSLYDKTVDSKAHFQRVSNIMSRMDSSNATSLPPASTVNYLWGRSQPLPNIPFTHQHENVNISHPESLHSGFPQQKQMKDNVAFMDIHKPVMGRALLPNQSHRQAAPLWPQMLQPRNVHETLTPILSTDTSSSMVIPQLSNHGQNQNVHGAAVRSMMSNQFPLLPSLSANDYHRPGTSSFVHEGISHPPPVGSVAYSSQMGTTTQNMGPDASQLPANNAYSGLFKSLMAQGLISVTASTSVQDPVGVEFNLDLLKVRYESALNALYSDLPRKCTTCGLRFKCQEKHSSHMDWHVTKNRVSKSSKQKPSRKWFVNTSLWLSGAEAVGTDALPGFWSTEADVEEKVEKEMAVPADENQDACALCGEPFDNFYNHEIEEWMYRGAVYLNATNGSTTMDKSQLGPIVHAKCRPESEEILKI